MFYLVKIAILDDENVDLLMVKKIEIFQRGFCPWFAHGFCHKLKILKLFLLEHVRC